MLVRPASRNPATAAMSAERMYRTTSTCQARAPERRAAIGLSPIAYSRRPYPERRRPTRTTAASGTNTRRLLGTIPIVRPDPSHRNRSGTPAPVWTMSKLPHVGEAQHDQAHAQGHDQRVNPEHADADARQEPRESGGRERDDDGGRHPPAGGKRRHDEPGHRGHGADREVDPARQHRQGLAAGEDRQDHRPAQDDAGPLGADHARPRPAGSRRRGCRAGRGAG